MSLQLFNASDHKTMRKQIAMEMLSRLKKKEHKPFVPQGNHQKLWDLLALKNEVACVGPAGTGKTRNILEFVHWIMEKFAGARGLLIRKTRTSLTESVMEIFETFVLYPDHPVLQRGGERNHRSSYKYPNGSQLVVGGIDQPTRMMSTEFDIVAGFEWTEATVKDTEFLRVRSRRGAMTDNIISDQMIYDLNPAQPRHHIKQRIDEGLAHAVHSNHRDNPMLYDIEKQDWTEGGKAYLKNLGDLTGVRKKRLYDGQWAAAEGIIFDGFDPSIHIIDSSEVPEFKRIIRVVDFGFVNAFVCLWLGEDSESDLFVYRQIYHTRRLVADHADTINMLSRGEDIETTICDHDAEDRATLKSNGIPNQPAYKGVSRGIEAVQMRFKKDDDGRPVKPTLYFVRDSLVEVDQDLKTKGKPYETTQEIDAYCWQEAADGKPVKDLPVKIDDHGCDTVRYGVCYYDDIRDKPRKRAGLL